MKTLLLLLLFPMIVFGQSDNFKSFTDEFEGYTVYVHKDCDRSWVLQPIIYVKNRETSLLLTIDIRSNKWVFFKRVFFKFNDTLIVTENLDPQTKTTDTGIREYHNYTMTKELIAAFLRNKDLKIRCQGERNYDADISEECYNVIKATILKYQEMTNAQNSQSK